MRCPAKEAIEAVFMSAVKEVAVKHNIKKTLKTRYKFFFFFFFFLITFIQSTINNQKYLQTLRYLHYLQYNI